MKNNREKVDTPFPHYKSSGYFRGYFRRSRAAYSVVGVPIWPKFELIQDIMHNTRYLQDQQRPRESGDNEF